MSLLILSPIIVAVITIPIWVLQIQTMMSFNQPEAIIMVRNAA